MEPTNADIVVLLSLAIPFNAFSERTISTRSLSYYNEITRSKGTYSKGNCSGFGGVPAKVGFDTGGQ